MSTRAWRNSIFVVFGISGLALASWFCRLPAVRDDLSATTLEMGLLVVALSGGSVIGLVFASRGLALWGSRRTIGASLVTSSLSLALVGVAISGLHLYWLAFLGLALYGIGAGCCNVSMNVEGAAVEHATGHTIMPGLHATFSIGGVVGAALGIAASALSLSVGLYLGVVGALVLTGAASVVRNLRLHGHAYEERRSSVRLSRPWRDPRTLAIGGLMLVASFSAGSANDWIALAMVDGHGATDDLASVALAVLVSSTTLTRILGGRLIDRFGRVAVLRASAIALFLGVGTFVLGQGGVVALLGTGLWGVGTALAFPIGVSAVSDDPVGAAGRISVVSTLGYAALLGGPLLIGVLGEYTGLLPALGLVAGAAVVVALLAPAARRRVTEPQPEPAALPPN